MSSDIVKRLGETLGEIQTPAMGGDNLAVTLCSHFDDGEDHDNDHGWSNAAYDGYIEVIEALRKHYAPAAALIESQAARIEALEKALRLAEKSEHDHMNCEDCEGSIEAELCETCFPAADAARLARWEALGMTPQNGRVINFTAARLAASTLETKP